MTLPPGQIVSGPEGVIAACTVAIGMLIDCVSLHPCALATVSVSVTLPDAPEV